MTTPTAKSNAPGAQPPPVLDNLAEDSTGPDRMSANQQPAEEQLKRFLQWLQFTDRGHQPC